MCYVVFLEKVGSDFVKFHTSLEGRSTDFTHLALNLDILTESMEALLSEDYQNIFVTKTNKVLSEILECKELGPTLVQIDAEVRPDEANEIWMRGLFFEHISEFQDSFAEGKRIRFPEESCKLTTAFAIYDPRNFPSFKTIDDSLIPAQAFQLVKRKTVVTFQQLVAKLYSEVKHGFISLDDVSEQVKFVQIRSESNRHF